MARTKERHQRDKRISPRWHFLRKKVRGLWHRSRNRIDRLIIWEPQQTVKAAQQLRFLTPNSAPPNKPTMRDQIREWWRLVGGLIIWLFIVTGGFAVAYFVGSSRGWGIKSTFCGKDSCPVAFWDSLHFSVVTITTVGYGDFRPESLSRILAAFEALVGVVLAGVLVARLVSRHQDKMLRRVVSGQINAEVQRFRAQLSPLMKSFDCGPYMLSQGVASSELNQAAGLVRSIARYWRNQANDITLPYTISDRAGGRLLGDMLKILECLALSTESKRSVDLHERDLNSIRRIAEGTLAASVVMVSAKPDASAQHTHNRIEESVRRLRKNLKLSARNAAN